MLGLALTSRANAERPQHLRSWIRWGRGWQTKGQNTLPKNTAYACDTETGLRTATALGVRKPLRVRASWEADSTDQQRQKMAQGGVQAGRPRPFCSSPTPQDGASRAHLGVWRERVMSGLRPQEPSHQGVTEMRRRPCCWLGAPDGGMGAGSSQGSLRSTSPGAAMISECGWAQGR